MSGTGEALVERTAPDHPAPVGLLTLWFGAVAAPLLWLIQVLWNYTATALACFPAEAPKPTPLYGWTEPSLFVFDVLAIVVALAGCAVSYSSWRKAVDPKPGTHALQVFDGRAHFMAVWGMLFSFGFLIAIVFETIASIAVPPCG